MTTDDDLWIMPPEWVHILDVPGWIIKQSDPADERFKPKIILELIRAVRRGKLIHRVAGIRRDAVYGRYPEGIGSSEHRPSEPCIEDWEASAPHWPSGTVGGWRGHDGQRERHRIEIWWRRVDEWAQERITFWRMDADMEAKKRAAIQAGAAANSVASSSRDNEDLDTTQTLTTKDAARANASAPALQPITRTIAAEGRAQQWLEDCIRRGDAPIPVRELLPTMAAKFQVGKNAARRARTAAIRATDAKAWSAAGRRPKKPEST